MANTYLPTFECFLSLVTILQWCLQRWDGLICDSSLTWDKVIDWTSNLKPRDLARRLKALCFLPEHCWLPKSDTLRVWGAGSLYCIIAGSCADWPGSGIASCSSASSHCLVNSASSCMRVLVGTPSEAIMFFPFDHQSFPNHTLPIFSTTSEVHVSEQPTYQTTTPVHYSTLSQPDLSKPDLWLLPWPGHGGLSLLPCSFHVGGTSGICICLECLKKSLFPLVSHFCAAMKICPACVISFLSLAH